MIHTVGPIYSGGNDGEPQLLDNVNRNSMKVALEYGICIVAFSSISTSVYSYPLEEAAKIAVATVREFYMEHPKDFDYVRFVLFDNKTRQAYDHAINEYIKQKGCS